MAMVARAGCVLCRHLYGLEREASIHHMREGQGLGQRAADFLAIGLCPQHHQGPEGWHGLGRAGFYQRYVLDEGDLLAMTIEGVAQLSWEVEHG